MKAKGFRPTVNGSGGKPAQHPVAGKARALWISLYQLGAVQNPSEAALEAFAKRQTGCDKLVWMKQSEGYRLVEALKSWAVREGWQQQDLARQKPFGPLALQTGLCHTILAKLKAAGHVPAQWGLHDAMAKLCGEENAREQAWTAEDYQRLAAQLGAKLRALGAGR